MEVKCSKPRNSRITRRLARRNHGRFVANGWAMEVKVDSVDATVDVETGKPRTRNEKGQLVVMMHQHPMLMKRGKVAKHQEKSRRKLLKEIYKEKYNNFYSMIRNMGTVSKDFVFK